MYSFEWMIGVALVALAGGLGLGALLGQSMASSRKVKSLQEELEASRQAHTDYRSEVYDQFSETARKFERMNESYRDLHQQLASSAVVLLGDTAGKPLLRGPNPSDQVIDADVTGIPEVGATTAAAASEAADPDLAPTPETPSANETELAATQPAGAAEDTEVAEDAEHGQSTEPRPPSAAVAATAEADAEAASTKTDDAPDMAAAARTSGAAGLQA